MTLFTGEQHLCTFNIVALHIYHLFLMFGRGCTPSSRPSLLMFRIDLQCCTGALAVVLSLLRRDRNRSALRRKRRTCGTEPHHSLWQCKESYLLLSRTSFAAGNRRFCNIHLSHPIWLHAITISSPKWNAGTKVAVLSKGSSSTAKSGTKVAV